MMRRTEEADVNRCHTPGRRKALRVALPLPAVAAVLGLLTANAMAAVARTVVTFDRAAGQTPESVAITPDGTAYVSLAFASQIRRITPRGSQATLTMPTAGGITVGVAIDAHHDNDLDVAVRSPDPAAAGIWRIPRVGFDHPTRTAALPTTSFPNGITFDADGNLYIADSDLGRIWRLARGWSQAIVWAQGPLLSPTGESFQGFVLPGANGLKIRGKTLYVSNTSTQNIIAIPIDREGTAGSMTVRFSRVQADDFAFAVNGDLYATENPLNRLVRITPSSVVTTVATASDGLENPSDVAFDPRPGHRRDLFITNSAYFGTHPSLQQCPTGTVGQCHP
jgi:sugar lactone lactonase YvrE